jgi:hypothetical protein
MHRAEQKSKRSNVLYRTETNCRWFNRSEDDSTGYNAYRTGNELPVKIHAKDRSKSNLFRLTVDMSAQAILLSLQSGPGTRTS